MPSLTYRIVYPLSQAIAWLAYRTEGYAISWHIMSLSGALELYADERA